MFIDDENEFRPFFIPFQNKAPETSVSVGTIKTNFSTSPSSMMVKRTKGEAIDRAQTKLAMVNRTFRGIPMLRPYVLGLNFLTYGLILIDPLDRLE